MENGDLSAKSVSGLFADRLTAERFLDWKVRSPVEYFSLAQYAIGEIFWHKSLGRPTSTKLSDGFTIAATHEVWQLVPIQPGVLEWVRRSLPLGVSWWDGQEDATYWRVPFLVGPIPNGQTNDKLPQNFLSTHITPAISPNVHWPRPVGVLAVAGFKTMKPHSTDFVKQDGAVQLSFEVVLQPLLVPVGGVLAKP